jgi:hypothetical protein
MRGFWGNSVTERHTMTRDDLAAYLIREAKKGNQGAAGLLAKMVRNLTAPGCSHPMPDVLRDYLILLAGTPGRKRRGRPKHDPASILSRYVLAHEAHYFDGPCHKEPGGSYFDVGKRHGRSPECVETWHRHWRADFENTEFIWPDLSE